VTGGVSRNRGINAPATGYDASGIAAPAAVEMEMEDSASPLSFTPRVCHWQNGGVH